MTRRVAIAVPVVALALALAGCETFDQVVEVGTGVAVATGNLSASQAASINKAGKAVSKTFDDITPEQEYYIGRTVAAT